MKKVLLYSLLGILGIAIIMGGYLIGLYNKLVVADQEVSNKWAQVEVVLQRRFDLIPNLVNSTKGVLAQEQKIFSDIAEARTRYSGAQSGSAEKVDAANQLESSFSRLLVIMENYPQLKSDQTVKALMDELAGTENRIAVERQRYNDSATAFNIIVKRFSTNLFAKLLGFEERKLFEAVQGSDVAPEVNLQ